MHGNTQGGTCQIFGKSLFSKNALQTHRIFHSSEKQLACEICERLYSDNVLRDVGASVGLLRLCRGESSDSAGGEDQHSNIPTQLNMYKLRGEG